MSSLLVKEPEPGLPANPRERSGVKDADNRRVDTAPAGRRAADNNEGARASREEYGAGAETRDERERLAPAMAARMTNIVTITDGGSDSHYLTLPTRESHHLQSRPLCPSSAPRRYVGAA